MAQARAAQIRLEQQITELISRVESLELRLAELESRPAPSEFELVSEVASSFHPISETRRAAPEAEPEDPDRTAALRHIASWIRSTLAGRRRGLSGRERIEGGNRCYLVFRDFSGRLWDPVFFSLDFQEVSRLVKPAGVPGDSVFIGLPSIAEGVGVQFDQ